VIGFAIGGGLSSEGCNCDGTAPSLDSNGDLECNDCQQQAFECVDNNGSQRFLCTPDAPTALNMGCAGASQQKDCTGNVGGTGGGADSDADDGGQGGDVDETGAGLDETGAGGGPCEDWDPDGYVAYDRRARAYVIEQALVDDLVAQPTLLWECDSTRAQIRSGGFYELRDVAPGDLSSQLGLRQDDVILKVEGYSLQWPDDYLNAYTALSQRTDFKIEVERRGKVITLEYEAR